MDKTAQGTEMSNADIGKVVDKEAVMWAISLLEIQPGVKANTNSQYWLRRLRVLVGMDEDAICKADLDNFLDTYCDHSSPGNEAATALSAAPVQPSERVGVPREPTKEMLQAGSKTGGWYQSSMKALWKAMYDAAPSAAACLDRDAVIEECAMVADNADGYMCIADVAHQIRALKSDAAIAALKGK